MNEIISQLTPSSKERWETICHQLVDPLNDSDYHRLWEMYERWKKIDEVEISEIEPFSLKPIISLAKIIIDLPQLNNIGYYQSGQLKIAIVNGTNNQARIIANVAKKVREFTNSEDREIELLFYPTEGSRKLTHNLTSSGIRRGKHIFLCRLEDYVRLSIHELNHMYNTDGYDTMIEEDTVPHPKCWQIKLNFMEGVTETNAIIEYCFYLTEQFNCSTEIEKKLLQWVFISELTYSRQLTSQVLNFFGYSDISQFFQPLNTNKPVKQPVFLAEYIIERTCFLWNLPKYLDIVGDNLNLSNNTSTKIELLQNLLNKPPIQWFPEPNSNKEFSYSCFLLIKSEK